MTDGNKKQAPRVGNFDKFTMPAIKGFTFPAIDSVRESIVDDLVSVQPMDGESGVVFAFVDGEGRDNPFDRFESLGSDSKCEDPQGLLWVFPEPSTTFKFIDKDEVKQFYDGCKSSDKRRNALLKSDRNNYRWVKYDFSYPLCDRRGLALVDLDTKTVIFNDLIIMS